MEEKPTEDYTETNQPEDSQTALPAPAVAETSKPGRLHKFSPRRIKLPRWLVKAVLILLFGGLLTGCFLLYEKSNDLSQQNKNLNSKVESYKKANAKPEKLTDAALLSVTSDVKTQPAPASSESGSYGGTAVQVNVEDSNSATPRYIGGEYAPYWLLTKFALTIPDGTKMVRTTDVSTNGRLLTADNEGGAGCGGEGIYMIVKSTVTVPGEAFRAWGSSATYKRGLGCGGADPIVAVYAKYTAMAHTSQYKYVELVTADCTDHDDDYNCVASSQDKSKWRLYSGIVLADAVEYKAGATLQGSDIARQLYSRDKNGAQFYIDCTDDKFGNFFCKAGEYKNGDYNAALKDSAYIQLKNIILNMHEY